MQQRISAPFRSISMLALLAGLAFTSASASGPFGEPLEVDPAVPDPASFLGYALGEQLTPHHRLVAYLETLAGNSERVLIERYGTTHEGRPLLLLTISSPRNLTRTREIQDAINRLADPRTLSRSEARELSKELPVVTWLSFNIHGDESSSSEAAMGLAYRLAADQGKEAQALLDSSIVLIDPCLNPDGRDRYVNWLRGVAGGAPDPRPGAREHHQPWPGGRYNHYLFDLNRDWAWLIQPESRARAAAYLKWRPQVHVDFHEMWAQSTYFFFPPERPIHALYPPQVETWANIFGEENAAAFDSRGWRYFTSESFDLYYPGYGDSWPTFHGAIGMTYEQAGHGFAGTALRRADGDTLTLAGRAEHHYVAGLTTALTSAKHREARLQDFHRFFEPGDRTGPAAYLFPPGADPPRTAQLVSLLMTHGAEVSRTRKEIGKRGLRDYDNNPAQQPLPPGTYVVSMDQPLHRFLGAVLEPEAALPDTFFYDVSAWSLPLAFGIDAFWSEKPINGDLEPLAEPPEVPGTLENPDATYAYLISWRRNNAARAAAWLLERDVSLHFATREFSIDGKQFSPGSLIAFRSENRPDLPATILALIEQTGADVTGVNSGLTRTGPDLGSSSVHKLVRPSVALVSGEPTMPTSVGACWFLLDEQYGLPHSVIQLDDIRESTLRDYTVLVLPDDGSGGQGYTHAMDARTLESIREWVEAGGVLVGLGGGAFFAATEEAGLTSVRRAPDPDEELSEEEQKEQEKTLAQEMLLDRERREHRERLPGTIFRVKVDPNHPLGFGYAGEARVLKISDRALELGSPGTNAAWFDVPARVSGYASEEMVDRLQDSPFLVDEPLGRGHVVLYVEDPNFRLFWYGLNRMFLNSLLFLGEAR